jgi:hypothetical protein
MAESRLPSAARSAAPHANRLAFRVVLRDADGFEGLDSRTLIVPLGSVFPIGRASRNSTKQDLAPAADNAYIDSPVISRDHAKLAAHADSGTPQVYITDSRSMHGTMVNGERLTPHVPKQLSAGDMLQFGVDVNRNEGMSSHDGAMHCPLPLDADQSSSAEFFVARKYTFEAHLDKPQPPFSQGFTVPDSDEEEVAPTPRRGSQNYPLTIDESDCDSETSDQEQQETTMVREGFTAAEVIEAVTGGSSVDASRPELAGCKLSFEGDVSADDDSARYSSDEQEGELEEDFDSGASLMGDSDIDYNSELEVSDMDAGDASYVADDRSTGEPEPDRTLPVQAHSEVPSIPPWAIREFSDPFDRAQPPSASELPPMNTLRQTFDSQVLNSFPPPLPPRPSTSNTSWFDRSELRSNFSSEMPSYPNYLGTSHGDRPSLFSPAPLQAMTNAQEAESAAFFDSNSTDFVVGGNRMQTPPPMPTSDITSSTPPPPSRRTMLSIDEIVQEQPPTPTSVNSMKRKADVLDVTDPDGLEQTVLVDELVLNSPGDVVIPGHVPAVDAAAQTAAVIAQRPKKQPRSIVSRVRNTAAYIGYSAMGAAGAVALLSYLPDAFFV